MKKSAILIAIILFLSSCQTLEELADVQKPRLSVDDVRVTGFNFNEIELTYNIKIDNPNPVSLQMVGYDYNLDINGNSFIQGDQQEGINIEASGVSMFEVPITVNFNELYRSIKGLAQKDESSYRFISHLAFDMPTLGRTEIPVGKQGSIPMLKLPKLSVENIAVNSLSLSGADIGLKLQIDNPNGFGMNVDVLQYDFAVNGSQWASGDALANTQIRQNGITELNIPISLDIGQIGRSAYRVISGDQSLNYKLDGNLKFKALHSLLGNSNLGINKSGQIPISR
ncbi:LEA type 2 family protein [Fodinibius salinus]|nr:LEA type 2 family protein [Fodinibius salinus]